MMSLCPNKLVKTFIFLAIICCALASMEDDSHNIIIPGSLYGRTLDADLLARLLVMPQRFCHPKRNSELINSLLSLPKAMNNAGK